ncbi:hypothetical protein Tco_1464746 [Tanacetum coccineum]
MEKEDSVMATKSLVDDFDTFITKLNSGDHATNSHADQSKLAQTPDGWEDPRIQPMGEPATKVANSDIPKSFVNAVSAERKTPKINFRMLFNDEHVENSDFVLPVANVERAKNRFANSLVGFFIGKRMAFQLVQNYVSNTWSKFGFQKVMKDDDDVFYFKFSSVTGLEQVLEQGPWMIRNQQLILTKWAPNLELSKDKVTKVPIWVKIHKVPIVAYSEDGLSLIASQIGRPVILDVFTSAMCTKPWGRIGYARALIEVAADIELKKMVTMAVPIINGEGYTKECMTVEYEWNPTRCSDCKVFGHSFVDCPKRVIEQTTDKVDEHTDGFTTVRNRKKKGKKVEEDKTRRIDGLKLTKPKVSYHYRRVEKGGTSNVSGNTRNTHTHEVNHPPKPNTNSFSVLANAEESELRGGEATWQNVKQVNDVLNESDSEEIEEVIMENPTGTMGASTPNDEVSNV